MSGITKVRLGEIARFQQGLQVGVEEQFFTPLSGTIRFLRIVDFTDDGVQPRYVKSTQTSTSYVTSADVSMIRYGSQTAGRAVSGKSGIIANNIFRIIPTSNPEIEKKYLYYYLNTPQVRSYLMDGQNSSTMPAITFTMIGDLSVYLHTIDNQRKIASILSTLDDKIELLNQINTELERLAKTLYDYWFVQFDFPNAEGKPYKSSGGAMIHSPELNRPIPATWKAIKLKDLLNKRTESSEPNAELKCIDLSVMPTNSLSVTDFNRGDTFNSNMKKMYKYDILFGSIRPYLKKSGMAPYDGLRAGTVHAFYPKNKRDYSFCLNIMTSERFFDFAISRSGGSTRMPSVSAEALLEYEVPYNEEVIARYESVLGEIPEKISSNIEQSQKLAELRDWLLPMLMNGQVKVV